MELPQQTTHLIDNVIFSSQFDSGNLVSVEKTADNSYDLFIGADCQGMDCQTASRIWFHFYVKTEEGKKLTLTLRNLNARGRMYREGFKPFFKNGENGKWKRIPGEIIFGKSDTLKGCWEISFTHTFSYDTVYFSFCYPWSYTENQRYLDGVERNALEMEEFYFHRENMIYTADGNRCDLLTISSFSHVSSEQEPKLPDLHPDEEPRAR